MTRSFNVRYRWTLDDFAVLSKAQESLTRARRIARVVFWVFVAGLLAAGALALWHGERFWTVYFFVLGLLLVSIRVLLGPWRRRRGFEHQRLGEFEIDFHADENGFSTRSDLAEGTHKWGAIRQVDDLPGHVLLWPNNRMGWMIPKRAFASPEEVAAFVALAKEKTDGQTL